MRTIGECARLACLWEVTARKPGNVHRYRDFDDLTYLDFVVSAAAIAPILDVAPNRSLGETILECIQATRRVKSTNTNLGIVLLLAPLAKAQERSHLSALLMQTTIEDARLTYQAIRLAQPGGMGEVPEQDVSKEPTLSLRDVMALAADRDLIALQYVSGFAQVFDEGVPALDHVVQGGATVEHSIVTCYLQLLAAHPDSLIARKCGLTTAEEASRRARVALDRGIQDQAALDELDRWLCADGHRRNPGTTADLVTASIFVALREEILDPLARFESY